MPDSPELEVRVVHASPGRLRLKVSPEAFQGEALSRAEQAFTGLQGLHSVQKSPLTGNLLILFDPKVLGPADLLAASASSGVRLKVLPPPERFSSNNGGTAIGQAITGLVHGVDEWTSHHTGGVADLRTVVPVTLGAVALRELLAGRLAPVPWYALLWYAFETFTKLQKPAEGAESSKTRHVSQD